MATESRSWERPGSLRPRPHRSQPWTPTARPLVMCRVTRLICRSQPASLVRVGRPTVDESNCHRRGQHAARRQVTGGVVSRVLLIVSMQGGIDFGRWGVLAQAPLPAVVARPPPRCDSRPDLQVRMGHDNGQPRRSRAVGGVIDHGGQARHRSAGDQHPALGRNELQALRRPVEIEQGHGRRRDPAGDPTDHLVAPTADSHKMDRTTVGGHAKGWGQWLSSASGHER